MNPLAEAAASEAGANDEHMRRMRHGVQRAKIGDHVKCLECEGRGYNLSLSMSPHAHVLCTVCAGYGQVTVEVYK